MILLDDRPEKLSQFQPLEAHDLMCARPSKRAHFRHLCTFYAGIRNWAR